MPTCTLALHKAAVALAVQPLTAWRELWLDPHTAEGWTLDVLLPGTGQPDVGYVEFAGWVHGDTTTTRVLKVHGGEDWQKTIEPVWWTARWLVLKDWMPDTYCGGAHGSWSIQFLTFDLNTGKFQDPWTWVSTKAGLDKLRSWGNQDEKPVGLRRLIEKRIPLDDCDRLFSLNQPYPTAKGMVFPTSYSHAARACNDEVVIPYKDLMPFLTPAGKAAVRSILAGE